MLTSKQRAFLRSKASAIDTTFQIGKGGVSENMLIAFEAALAAHEMIKVKCLENCEYTPREACDGIAEALDADGVQCIGNKFVLFKISPEHRHYDLEKLTLIEEKEEKPKKSIGKNASHPQKKDVSKSKGEKKTGQEVFSRTAVTHFPRNAYTVSKKKK